MGPIFNVYLKEKPDFGGLVAGDMGIKHYQSYALFESYRWDPEQHKYPIPIWIDYHLDPKTYYSRHFDRENTIEDRVKQAQSDGITIPKPFVNMVLHEGDQVVADRGLYGLLQQYPELEEQFPELSDVWKVLKLNEGNPTHCLTVFLAYQAPESVIKLMGELAVFFAEKFNGVVTSSEFRP